MQLHHAARFMALNGGYYHIAGNFRRCKICINAVLALVEIFLGFYFHISLNATIGHALMCRDLVSNFPLAWHFFTENRDPANLVGMVDLTVSSTEANLLLLLFVT